MRVPPVWKALCAVAMAAALCVPASAAADTYTADLTTDVVSVVPCPPEPTDVPCQLRDAIKAAALHAGPDTVQLVAGTYQQGFADSGADNNSDGDFDYGSGGSLAIAGVGQGVSIIDRAGGDDRLFELSGTDSVTLSGLSLINGWTYHPAVDGANGGAIEARIGAPGKLILNDVTINGGEAFGNGGGIYSSSNDLQLNRVTLRGNYSGFGGVVASPGGSGAGVALGESGAPVSAEINDSTLRDNQAYDADTATLPGSDGGGVFVSGNGVVPDPAQTLTNSTLDTNHAYGYGGGAYVGYGEIGLINTTISHNNANSDISGAERGGGIESSGGFYTIRNSVIAANTVGAGSDAPNCNAFQRVTSQGGNVVGAIDPSFCSAFTGPGDLTGVANPLLGALASNGGPTATVALLPGSPAIDHAGACGLGADQRGIPRPQGPACDSGAFEVPVPVAAPSVVAAKKKKCRRKKRKQHRAAATKKKKKCKKRKKR
jgi:hypothetical protein